MNDDAPKSAIELAMARLKQKDTAAGTVDTPLTEAQKAAIADTRQVYAARRAQAEIMHASSLASAFDMESLGRLKEEFRRDTDRMTRELEEKIAGIRRGSGEV
jgi:hypothetical protein